MASQDRSWISSLAALGSVVAASLCCLPLLPLALAAGGASAAWFTASKFQPYLLGLSALFIVYGFWQARRAQQCSTQRRALNFALLSVAAVMTAGVILFPQAIANVLTPGSTGVARASVDPAKAIALTDAAQFQNAFNNTPADATIIVGLYSPT